MRNRNYTIDTQKYCPILIGMKGAMCKQSKNGY